MDPVKQQAFIDDFMSEFYETVEMTPTEKDSFISSLRDFYVKHLVIIVEAPAAVAVSTGVTTPAVSTTDVVAGSGTVPSAVAGGTGKKRGPKAGGSNTWNIYLAAAYKAEKAIHPDVKYPAFKSSKKDEWTAIKAGTTEANKAMKANLEARLKAFDAWRVLSGNAGKKYAEFDTAVPFQLN